MTLIDRTVFNVEAVTITLFVIRVSKSLVRELQSQIERVRDVQAQEDRRQTMLMSENARLRLEKRRAEERQGILEEHNRVLEMEMQKMRLLLQQVHDEIRLRKAYAISLYAS